MTHGDDTSAHPRTLDGNLAGQAAIVAMLGAQADLPERSRLARIFGASPLSPEARAWYSTALSEIAVGEELAGLPAEWSVLHALPVGVGSSDLDHIVIGPAGVFIVNTKNHPGQVIWVSQRAFLVSGIRYPYIRNMEYEMGRTERLLTAAAGSPVEVSGILAVVAAKSLTVRDKHRDVTVLPSGGLAEWLLEQPRVLGAQEVGAIAASAALESTWHVSATRVDDRGALRASFDALRVDVRRAWRRQVVWATLATLLGAGGFIVVTVSVLFSALAALTE